MKSETEIRERKKALIEKLKSMKHDIETTMISGQLKKDNSLLYNDWVSNAMGILTEIYHLSWVLDEPMTQDIYDLTRI